MADYVSNSPLMQPPLPCGDDGLFTAEKYSQEISGKEILYPVSFCSAQISVNKWQLFVDYERAVFSEWTMKSFHCTDYVFCHLYRETNPPRCSTEDSVPCLWSKCLLVSHFLNLVRIFLRANTFKIVIHFHMRKKSQSMIIARCSDVLKDTVCFF